MTKLKNDQWLQIKTRYALGDSIRAIARSYGISDGTIHARIKKEKWTQDLSTKVVDITSKIQEIKQDYESSQLPIIQELISAQLTLINVAEDFISIAARLNLQAIQELQDTDVKTKIIGLNGLKATMDNLVKLVGLQKEINSSYKKYSNEKIEETLVASSVEEASKVYLDMIKNS